MQHLPGLYEAENTHLEQLACLIAQHLKLTDDLVEMFRKVDSVMDSDAGKAAVAKLLPIWRAQVNDRIILKDDQTD